MHRQNLLTELHNYSSNKNYDLDTFERLIIFIHENSDCFIRSNLSGHITGSSFIVNKNRSHTLLVHHAKLNKWLQPGGHADGETNIFEVALREAKEETGLNSFASISQNNQIFDIDIHEIPKHKNIQSHYHYDIRYIFEADMSEQIIISEESHDVKWIDFKEIESYSTDDSVIRMINKVRT